MQTNTTETIAILETELGTSVITSERKDTLEGNNSKTIQDNNN